MASGGARPLMALLLAAILVAGPDVASALTCGQVNTFIAPCLPYVVNGGAIPPRCCPGVSGLNAAARTTVDRQQACNCLKSILGRIRGINLTLVAGLPGRCGVAVPYPISPSTNCARVR